MARLQAKSKLLYYPTPISVAIFIATYFSTVGKKLRIVDPCCGTGDAIREIADRIVGAPGTEKTVLGIELSYARAEEAKKVIDRVLPVSFYNVATANALWPQHSVSLLFNNPPYDWSEYEETLEGGTKRRARHEWLFVTMSTPKVIPGGTQVILVPRMMLGATEYLGKGQEGRMARHLLGWYEQVHIYKFPDPDYDRFKQVAIFAVGKRARYQIPLKDDVDRIVAMADEAADIPVLGAGCGQFLLPDVSGPFRFEYVPANPVDLINQAKKYSPLGNSDYQRATYVRYNGAPINPAVPINIGHLTLLIAGNETGTIEVKDAETGKRLLMKGSSRKEKKAETEPQFDAEGKITSYKVVEKEYHVSTMAVTREDGEVAEVSDPSGVAALVKKYGDALSDAVLGKNQPLYSFNPLPWEWEISGQTALGLPPLPGREERGLFPTQRHFAIAMKRILDMRSQGILNAEMGFGKTSTTITTLEIHNKWPVLLSVPGHMLHKWRRDLERVSILGDPITARIITRPVRNEPGKWVEKIKPIILGHLIEKREGGDKVWGEIVEMTRYQTDPVSPADMGGRRHIVIRCPLSIARRIATDLTKPKLALTFRDKLVDDLTGKETPIARAPMVQYTTTGLEIEYIDRDDYTMQDFAEDYRAGRLGFKAAAVIGFEAGKYDAGYVRSPAIYKHAMVHDERSGKDVIKRIGTCPTCGGPIRGGDFCINIIVDKVTVDGVDDKGLPLTVERKHECGAPLFELTRWRRTGLARLVQKKYKHFFKVYVFDEAHKAQGGYTDIGVADQRYISSIKYGIALTGTLFGGTAGSLFNLLYRRVHDVRKLFRHKDMNRWVDAYGLWENEWSQEDPYVAGKAASSGMERLHERSRELPGVGPGVIRFLLPITIFGNITDLGYELPELYENVELLDMPEAMADEYAFIKEDVLKTALQMMKDGDKGVISAWFTAMRFRPASAFRDEQIILKGSKGDRTFNLSASCGVGDYLPKETRLAEMVRNNMRRGRKTLVFVEQTGTRDIREHIKAALLSQVPDEELGIREPRVGIMSADDMPPARREAWIVANAPSFDVFIVNPKLVETGLDLIQFSNLVFFEITTSLYTLWQSMRRVWRLGQSSDVEVDFLAYRGTMEETILARMGKKMKFAALLYGKDAAGVLIESDGDDIAREIIKEAISGKTYAGIGEVATDVHLFSDSKSGRAPAAPVVRPAAKFPTSLTVAPTTPTRDVSAPVHPLPAVDLTFSEPALISIAPEDEGEAVQLGFFGEAVKAADARRPSHRRRAAVSPGQLSLWGEAFAAD